MTAHADGLTSTPVINLRLLRHVSDSHIGLRRVSRALLPPMSRIGTSPPIQIGEGLADPALSTCADDLLEPDPNIQCWRTSDGG